MTWASSSLVSWWLSLDLNDDNAFDKQVKIEQSYLDPGMPYLYRKLAFEAILRSFSSAAKARSYTSSL